MKEFTTFALPKLRNKKRNNMDRQDILNAVKSLAMSQGFYTRLYEVLTSGTEEAENLLDQMVEQNFKDSVDMVMWLEC